ncbi:hypothetical protein BM526_20275 (plasmid) [Alteromonas mediterranea]|uniref:hypothetical protein n=1 Tax=Alteromonas mediterranea TaxID=314275 RepID=UPI00090330C9|nr:hypothetical protein [Alteromonas mediterranea]APE04311.1 hypothetical protein BM526_20275 [Alteromonas mediterranea]
MQPSVDDINNLCLFLEGVYQEEENQSHPNGLGVKGLYQSLCNEIKIKSKLTSSQIRGLTLELYSQLINAETINLALWDDRSISAYNEEAFIAFAKLNDLSVVPLGGDICLSDISLVSDKLSNMKALSCGNEFSTHLTLIMSRLFNNGFCSVLKPGSQLNQLAEISYLAFSSSPSIAAYREHLKELSFSMSGQKFSFFDLFISYFDSVYRQSDFVLRKQAPVECVDSVVTSVNPDILNAIYSDLVNALESIDCKDIDLRIALPDGSESVATFDEMTLLLTKVDCVSFSNFVIGPLNGDDTIQLDSVFTDFRCG